MTNQQLIKRFNEMVLKLNQLEGDNNRIYDLISEDYSGTITVQDVRYMEDHYIEMKQRYKELKIGVFAE